MYDERVCVLRNAVRERIELAQEGRLAGNFGSSKSIGWLSDYPSQRKSRDARKFRERWSVCQQHEDHVGELLNDSTALKIRTRGWRIAATDFNTYIPETKSGFNVFMTLVDRLSRWGHSVPSTSTYKAEDAASEFFKSIFPQNGIHNAIVSDRDLKCTLKFWREFMKLCDFKLRISSAWHSHTDGASETVSCLVEIYIRCYCKHKQTDWYILLPAAYFSYSSVVAEDLGATPFEIDSGWKPWSPLKILAGENSGVQAVADIKAGPQVDFEDALYAHQLAKARQRAESGQSSKLLRYEVGDEIWVSGRLRVDGYSNTRPVAELAAGWFGPCKMLKLIGRNAVKLKVLKNMILHGPFQVQLT